MVLGGLIAGLVILYWSAPGREHVVTRNAAHDEHACRRSLHLVRRTGVRDLNFFCHANRWQARRESNPQPAVLETAALPIELLAYVYLATS